MTTRRLTVLAISAGMVLGISALNEGYAAADDMQLAQVLSCQRSITRKTPDGHTITDWSCIPAWVEHCNSLVGGYCSPPWANGVISEVCVVVPHC
jgi:hypothetical protein